MIFLIIAALVLFLRLLPLSPGTSGFIGPDITLAVIIAWVLRRPEYVPVGLIMLVMIAEDLMFQRAPGLWPLIVLMATQMLRKRAEGLRELPFVLEFGLIAMVLLLMVLVQRTVLFVTLVPQPYLGLQLLHTLHTIAVYPVVVAISALVLGIKRPAPGEVDELGHPI